MRRIGIFVLSTLSLCAPTHATPLGRLFTTPTERAILDQARITGHMPEVIDKSETASTNQVTLNGYVTRKNGKSTTWINQVAHGEKDPNKFLHVSQLPNQAPIIFLQTQSGKKIPVGVGDTVDIQSATVREVFANSR